MCNRLYLNDYIYCLGKADFNLMRSTLSSSNLDQCLDFDDVNDIWNNAETILTSAINESVPKKRVKSSSSVPWVTRDIRKLCTRKKILYRRAKQSIKSDDAWRKFQDCSNRLKSCVRDL